MTIVDTFLKKSAEQKVLKWLKSLTPIIIFGRYLQKKSEIFTCSDEKTNRVSRLNQRHSIGFQLAPVRDLNFIYTNFPGERLCFSELVPIRLIHPPMY